jgi:hypothetical protein
VEKRLASLPPDQRAYERFRFWSTMLPPDQQRDPNLLTRYREYLKALGFGDGDAEAQLKLVREQGSRAEIERWNRILTAENPIFNVKPNEFLVEMAKGRKPGNALDVGMGQGRQHDMACPAGVGRHWLRPRRKGRRSGSGNCPETGRTF